MKLLTTLLLLLVNSFVISQNFWQKTSFPSGSQTNSVYSILGLEDNSILVGTFSMGIYKSTDNGQNWLQSGLSSQWIIDLKKDNLNNLYALTVGSAFGSGLFKSTDNGNNWNRVWEYQGGLNCLYVDQNNNVYIGLQYSGGQGGVYKSSNGGVSWTNIFPLAANVYAIIKSLNGTLLLATYENGLAHIYRSTNEGNVWNKYSFSINFTSTDFTISNQGKIFLSTAGYGIYTSTDNGNTWTISANVGPDFSCLYLDNNTIFAGTRGNWVYRSTDLGSNWTLLNSGMGQDNYVLSLGASKNGYLFAGMDYYGIYRSANQVVSADDNSVSPENFILYQNYPNPFNPSTTIDFKLAVDSKVVLKVFDILGQEILTLVNEFLSAGNHKINFNVGNLNSGVYFYRIDASGFDGKTFNAVKKMIINK